jgi:hypothetical protein
VRLKPVILPGDRLAQLPTPGRDGNGAHHTQLLALEEVDFRKLRLAYPGNAAIEAVPRSLMVQLRETPVAKAARL